MSNRLTEADVKNLAKKLENNTLNPDDILFPRDHGRNRRSRWKRKPDFNIPKPSVAPRVHEFIRAENQRRQQHVISVDELVKTWRRRQRQLEEFEVFESMDMIDRVYQRPLLCEVARSRHGSRSLNDLRTVPASAPREQEAAPVPRSARQSVAGEAPVSSRKSDVLRGTTSRKPSKAATPESHRTFRVGSRGDFDTRSMEETGEPLPEYEQPDEFYDKLSKSKKSPRLKPTRQPDSRPRTVQSLSDTKTTVIRPARKPLIREHPSVREAKSFLQEIESEIQSYSQKPHTVAMPQDARFGGRAKHDLVPILSDTVSTTTTTENDDEVYSYSFSATSVTKRQLPVRSTPGRPGVRQAKSDNLVSRILSADGASDTDSRTTGFSMSSLDYGPIESQIKYGHRRAHFSHGQGPSWAMGGDGELSRGRNRHPKHTLVHVDKSSSATSGGSGNNFSSEFDGFSGDRA